MPRGILSPETLATWTFEEKALDEAIASPLGIKLECGSESEARALYARFSRYLVSFRYNYKDTGLSQYDNVRVRREGRFVVVTNDRREPEIQRL